MRVSCLCPTFARAYLLEEAVYSFLQQDFEDSELVICNDFSRQCFTFDHPRVRVVNLHTRCATLGDKRNETAAFAKGDLLLTWGDDDIHLPHRIRRIVAAYERSAYKPMMREGWFYTIYGSNIKLNKRSPTGACLVEREAYWRCGGIPVFNSGEDRMFLNTIRAAFPIEEIPYVAENPAFVYRWSGSGRPHISAFGRDAARLAVGKRSGYDEMLRKAEILVASGKEPSGSYTLKPHWKMNYTEAIASKHEALAINGEVPFP